MGARGVVRGKLGDLGRLKQRDKGPKKKEWRSREKKERRARMEEWREETERICEQGPRWSRDGGNE